MRTPVALAALVLAAELLAVRPAAPASAAAPEQLVIQIDATHPHDRTAYTQGLLERDGVLFESTGIYGRSTVREVDPQSGTVTRSIPLPSDVFAEGLALVGERLIQISWREGRAFEWDRATFQPLGELAYEGEGWGLCYDGERLVMSDGSDRLTFRDPVSFAPLGSVDVRLDGQPMRNLNELECVDGAVYANVWRETFILRIDPTTGAVTAHIDGSAIDADLRARYDLPDAYDCLNGIARIPGTDGFYITGKHWPELYEARFVPVADATASAMPTPDATATATSSPTPTATIEVAPAAVYLPVGWAGRR